MRWPGRVAFGSLAALGGLLVWGMAIEPRFIDQTEFEVQIPRLPGAWHGQRVAIIGDFQIGMPLANTDTMHRLVRRLVRERPALVLFLGDVIYHPTDDTRPCAQARLERKVHQGAVLLRPLVDAGILTYAVLGNHDYGMRTRDANKNAVAARRVREELTAVGVRVLRNEAVALASPDGATGEPDGDSLYLVGIGPRWPHEDDVDAALARVPENAPRLVMMHHPASFPACPAGAAPVAVAGHTHGGQMRLPFKPQWSYLSLIKHDTVHADGWYRHWGQPNNDIYVNRGIGFSTFPARINCMPELTIFTLEPAEAREHEAMYHLAGRRRAAR